MLQRFSNRNELPRYAHYKDDIVLVWRCVAGFLAAVCEPKPFDSWCHHARFAALVNGLAESGEREENPNPKHDTLYKKVLQAGKGPEGT